MEFSGFSAFAPNCAPHPAGAASDSSHRRPARAQAFIIPNTPGIPFGKNPFAALGMVPGAILCVLLLLLPYGGWRSCLPDTPICVILAPIICAPKDIDMALFPAIVRGFRVGVGISRPVCAFFSALEIKTDGNARAGSLRPVADERAPQRPHSLPDTKANRWFT